MWLIYFDDPNPAKKLDFDEKLFTGQQKISLFLASDQTAN